MPYEFDNIKPKNIEDSDQEDSSIQPQDQAELPNKQLNNVVRKYELKKIYAKLHSIEVFLYNNNTFDKQIIILQKKITTSIELFHYFIDNLKSYLDQIDNIIDIFNKFIKEIYFILSSYTQK